MSEISEIWVYPVKSLPGIKLQTALLDKKGLLMDRQWMLVDQQGDFLSQRRLPSMALFRVEWDQFGISLSYPGMETIIVPFEDPMQNTGQTVSVKIWQDICPSRQISPAIDQWFSEALQYDCRLVMMPSDHKRQVDTRFAEQGTFTRFSDGFPLLLISQASLEDLNRRIGRTLSMRRFRPNLVVSGCEAYAEDQWLHFSVGNIVFDVVKPCSRCVITTINPDTGEKEGPEPLKTLHSYRAKDNKVYFGQNVLLHLPVGVSQAELHCGDQLSRVKRV